MDTLFYRNTVELQGVVMDCPIVKHGETVLILKTVETIGERIYKAEHDVRVRGIIDAQQGDFLCVLNGVFGPDNFVVVDPRLVKNLGQLDTRDVRFTNHIVMSATVSSDIRTLSQGHTFELYTEVRTTRDGDVLKSIHTVITNGKLAPIVANTRRGDFVIVEGHIAYDRKIIIRKFSNISVAHSSATSLRVCKAS
jgi:hypothetical protein